MKTLRFSKQAGASLMDVLVAMSISLVVTASMIAMMSNSLGTTARIVKMTKLTDDMRVAMQMMTRGVRRSSYNAMAKFCYANDDCGSDTSGLTLAADIAINDTNSCFTFLTDRDHDGNSTEEEAGGFRHVTPGGVGVIEMYSGTAANPDCGADPGTGGWVEITNPDNMDIFAFSVDDALSYDQLILDNGTETLSQRVRKIRVSMEGQLVLDNDIQRHVEDVINVRNDLLL